MSTVMRRCLYNFCWKQFSVSCRNFHKELKQNAYENSRLRSFFAEEMINSQFKKFVENSSKFAYIYEKIEKERHKIQTYGTIVSHVALCFSNSQEDQETALKLNRYKSISQITEMVYTARQIHKGVMDVLPETKQNVQKDLENCNKLCILTGDYLLAEACKKLSFLRNPMALELISEAISDFLEAEFIDNKEKTDFVQAWEHRTFLSIGSLLANSCRAAAVLANEADCIQDLCFHFGKAFALGLQARHDIDLLVSDDTKELNISSLPVAFHKSVIKAEENDGYNSIMVLNNTQKTLALENSIQFCNENFNTCLQLLKKCKETKSRSILENTVLNFYCKI